MMKVNQSQHFQTPPETWMQSSDAKRKKQKQSCSHKVWLENLFSSGEGRGKGWYPPGIFLNAVDGWGPGQGAFRGKGRAGFAVRRLDGRTVLQLSVGIRVAGGRAGGIAGPLEGGCGGALRAVLAACALQGDGVDTGGGRG